MNDKIIIFTIFYVLAFFLFYKYWKIKKRIKNKVFVDATVTDIIVRQFYNKKEYIIFYKFVYQKEDCKASDKSKLPLLKYFFKNEGIYPMFVNPNNEKDYVSPYETKIYKYYLFGAILAIIVPLLFYI